ncbi:type II toxin-antitoxin system HigB family toxin [Photorhabdus sp. RW14-46]|uniref:type II toxin-antitoxin system HigB family toxin n=1 Tax=Photorhabdus sp. RW14-46 TaxID=2100168 RepID=UPI0013F4A5E9|nr:type II toxin-antitoxin system HigB family toxin [Photorhabdus sp. RW14-46]NHB60025.1 hypothetical protein [Photorhabdus sp. RW14-46]
MHVISKDPFEKAARDFPNDADAIIATYKQLKEKDFENPAELRNQFPSLDNFKYRDKWWVIDRHRDERMIAEPTKALEAIKVLVATVPFF